MVYQENGTKCLVTNKVDITSVQQQSHLYSSKRKMFCDLHSCTTAPSAHKNTPMHLPKRCSLTQGYLPSSPISLHRLSTRAHSLFSTLQNPPAVDPLLQQSCESTASDHPPCLATALVQAEQAPTINLHHKQHLPTRECCRKTY